MEKKPTTTFSDNPFLNILVNVLAPVIILKKGPQFFPALSPLSLLLLAVALPVAFGLWDYLIAGRKNYVSILGVLNTLLTGGFALMEMEGFWFALKEGILPLLIGVFVLMSLRHRQNFVERFFIQPQLMDTERIQTEVATAGKTAEFKEITQRGTFLFSLSFLLSALLNLTLGIYTFTPIDAQLPPLERAAILNDQIAQMTWLGYVVIALPLTVGTGLLLWWLLKRISLISNLSIEDILRKS